MCRLPREMEEVRGLDTRNDRRRGVCVKQVRTVPGHARLGFSLAGRHGMDVMTTLDEIGQAMPPDETRCAGHEDSRSGRLALGHATTATVGTGTTKRPPQSRTGASCSTTSSAMFQGRMST